MRTRRFTADARRVLLAQTLRGFAYGFGSVLLGVTLDARGFSATAAGFVLAAVITGTVVASLLVGRYADRIGRRRCYAGLHVLLGVAGVAFAVSDAVWLLILVALTGALSTEVIESGPFTSIEQAILASELTGNARVRGFGTYNAVAAAAGSLGALAAGGLALLRTWWPGAPPDAQFFVLFVPIALAGVALARTLTPSVEIAAPDDTTELVAGGLQHSRPTVVRLAGLFAMDSFGGGFTVQAFIAYWLAVKFGAAVGTIGVLFFAIGALQTASFMVAPRIAERFGLLPTMVFTHLPSNLLLMAVAFAPNLGVAITLLLARTALSQMDVPTRQAYVMALVSAQERTAAAAYTNTARYVVRPLGPVFAGAAQSVALGLPFLLAGTIKITYDLILWRWFAGVELPHDRVSARDAETEVEAA